MAVGVWVGVETCGLGLACARVQHDGRDSLKLALWPI